MALHLKQEQRLSQKLIMTPQMQQSIQLLQMSALELEQMAVNEVMQNPFLELADESDRIEDEQHSEALGAPEILLGDTERIDYASAGAEPESSDHELADAPIETVPEKFDQVDCDWETTWDGAETRAYSPPDPDEEDRDFTQYVARTESLSESLMWQLRVSVHGDRNLKIGQYIVGSLEEDGYLRIPLDEIADALKVSVAEVESILAVVQTFDPVGVGARSLEECLTIQLRHKGISDPVPYAIVAKHLDLLQKKKFKEIGKAIGTDETNVRQAFKLISSLDPRPGGGKSSDEVRYILPDVLVRQVDDRYVVFLNEGRTSGLRVNEYYKSLLQKEATFQGPEKEFASEKLKGAIWLIRNIEKRKNTIIKVAEAIVDFQQAFFEKGPSGLRPLTLREVAEVVGMHESTVARVTSSKYMDTPRGILEFKYFFSPGLQTDSGEEASSTSIKEMLLELIAAESPKKPYSDQKIAELIRAKGINIARRTVAKYREQLKILSAKQRREVQ